MSKILNILEGEDKDFRYYSAKGHASTPLEFGQKSIPYGMDEPGGGWSKQPYIERTQGRLSFSIEELTNSLVDISKAESAVVDVARMTKWFTTPLSNGILFNAKQVHQASLQEKNYQYSIGADLGSNPKKTFSTALSNLVEDIGNGAVNTGHILRQVGGNALNLHFSNPLTDKYRVIEFDPGQTGNVAGNGFENKEVQGRSNYGKFNRQTRYNTGNVGQPRLNRTDPFGEGITDNGEITSDTAANAPTVDKVTFSPIYQGSFSDSQLAMSDMVPFYITVLSNDNINDNVHLHFRAFIDSFADSYNADWQPHRFMGRGESFYTYNGFGRSINMSFKVHAQSKQELMPMYNKLNYLASVMAPDYNMSNGGFMRGNLIRLTVGDYIVEVPGILTGFGIDVPPTYPWDIGRDKDGFKTGDSLPTLLNVGTFNFTPIHDFVPNKPTLDENGIQENNKFINNNTIFEMGA